MNRFVSASLVRLATLFGTAVMPPAIALPVDSLQVNVQGPASMPAYIETIDAFDNNTLLQRGRNQLPTPTLLRDAHWQHDVIYPVTQTGTYRLVPDEHNQYWIIKTGDAQRDAALNFYVAYRREMAPITRPDQQGADMHWHLARFKSTQRDSLLQLQLSRQLLFLQRYAQEHQLTQQQIDLWRTTLQHTMRYKQLTLSPKLLTPTYIQRLAQLAPTFTDDSSLYMPPYQLAALQCAFMVAAHRSNTPKPTLTQRYDAAQSAFKGQTRDLILTRLLLLGSGMLAESASSTPSRQEVSQLLTRYFTDCQTASYTNYVRRATSLSPNTLKDGSLLTHTSQVVSFSQATTGARLTYVDFWASWCAPCRAEMPHSKELQARYGSKGVRFVYVSLDKNPAAWDRAVQTLGLAHSYSYLLVNNYQSSLAKQLSLTSIPRYVLLGKDGQVISANAPRPSTAALQRLLTTYLDK